MDVRGGTGDRVAVFGATGFIGSHVVRACLGAGHAVTAIVRPGGHAAPLTPSAEGLQVIYGDFTVRADVLRGLLGATTAIALVGSTVPATAVNEPTHEIFATVIPYINFLDVAAECGTQRVLLASSGGTVYGDPDVLPVPEDHPLRPISPYGVAKATIEHYASFFHHQRGLDSRILRIANPYGPGQRVETGQGVIAKFLAHALDGTPVEIYGDGQTARDFIYVEDVADAFVRCIDYSGPEQVFNIGRGEGETLTEVLAVVEAVTGRQVTRRYRPARLFDVRANVLDIRRAQNELAWLPRTSLHAGLRKTLAMRTVR